MINRFIKILYVGLILVVVSSMLVSADKPVYIESQVLYEFESKDEWLPISGSRYLIETPMNEDGTIDSDDPEIANGLPVPRYDIYPAVPEGIIENSENSIGITVSFLRKGYNYFDLIPAEQKIIPGQVKFIDFWIWGGNYDYNVEIILEDHLGYTHVLKVGSLKYYGWRNHTVEIPRNIPQTEPKVPQLKGLKFLGFRFWSEPNGDADRFHVFIDYLKVLTDIYKTKYDGDEIEAILAEELNEESSSQYLEEEGTTDDNGGNNNVNIGNNDNAGNDDNVGDNAQNE